MFKTYNLPIKNNIIKNYVSNIKKRNNTKKIIFRKNKFHERKDPLFQSNQTVINYIEKKLNEKNQSVGKQKSGKNNILSKTINNQKSLSKPKITHTATNSINRTKEIDINQKNNSNKSHIKVLKKTKTLSQVKLNTNNLSMTRNRIFNINENFLNKNKTVTQKQSNSNSTAISINENNKIKEKFDKKKLLSIYTPSAIDSLKQVNTNKKDNNNVIYNNRYNNNVITFPENIFNDLLEEKKPIDECPVPTPYVKKYSIGTSQETINNKKNNNRIKSNVKKTMNQSSAITNNNLNKKSINKISHNKSISNKIVENYKNKEIFSINKNQGKYIKVGCFCNSNLNKIPIKKRTVWKVL